MTQKDYILQEIKEIAPSLQNLNAMPYHLPNGYFEQLAQAIMLRINSQQPVYTVPENYFNNLAANILQKIKATPTVEHTNEVAEELQQIAPLLNTISKQNVYSVPFNYFETLTPKTTTNKAKFGILAGGVKWIKYAAAAVIGGIITISSYNAVTSYKIAQKHSVAVNTNIDKSLQNISLDELNKAVADSVFYADNTLSTSNHDEQETKTFNEIKKLSDEDLEYLINHSPNTL